MSNAITQEYARRVRVLEAADRAAVQLHEEAVCLLNRLMALAWRRPNWKTRRALESARRRYARRMARLIDMGGVL